MDDYRSKAASKVSLDTKLNIKKAQLTTWLEGQTRMLERQFKDQCLMDSSAVIGLKIEHARLTAQLAERDKLLFEQELMINNCLRQRATTIQQVNKIDLEQVQELEEQLQNSQQLTVLLREKILKLLHILCTLQLYTLEYSQKVQQDNFDLQYLMFPKLPDTQTAISKLQDTERTLKQNLKDQFEQINSLQSEVNSLRAENNKLRGQLSKYDITASINLKKLSQTLKSYQEQIEEKDQLILDLTMQARAKSKCKELNDFIIKKRFASLHEQPNFDFQESSRRVILSRNYARKLQSSPQQRIHSQTMNIKFIQ